MNHSKQAISLMLRPVSGRGAVATDGGVQGRQTLHFLVREGAARTVYSCTKSSWFDQRVPELVLLNLCCQS
jgi:hypothetical protein